MRRLIELSHPIIDGMLTHPGIPGPTITTWLTHAASAERYAEGTTFEIGRIDLVANTGTYVDTPAHRFAGRPDLEDVPLERFVDLDGLLVDASGVDGKAIEPAIFDGLELEGKAVLIRTGWDVHWGTDTYLANNPYLSEAAAESVLTGGAALVGIDSLNIDSLTDPRRPAHTTLLKAGVPIVEHLTGLEALPTSGWRFFAAPPRIRGMATFPVRAYAIVP